MGEGAYDCDVAIVGGGLAGTLAACAIMQACPSLRLQLIESGPALGGNHRWSCFDSDLDARGRELIAGIKGTRWPGYEVKFPGRARKFSTFYQSITSELLHDWASNLLSPDALILNSPVREVAPHCVILADSSSISARNVIDARGDSRRSGLVLGWQKFIGAEFEVIGHGILQPIIMDATVDQADGYRFVYVLPLGPDRLFLEDTYYADGPELSENKLIGNLNSYLEMQGFKGSIISKERGSLPIVLSGDPDLFWPQGEGHHRIGMAAGLFHHTTGYSLPMAVKTAIALADAFASDADLPAGFTRNLFVQNWKKHRFSRLINRMLFWAAKPDGRAGVLSHFHRLPQSVIERFYAGELRFRDYFRILSGVPPVPVLRAMRAMIAKAPYDRL